MKSIFHRVLKRSPEKKKKTQSTNEILLPVMYGKKTLLRGNFRILLDYFALTGNTECQHDGQFGGRKFLFEERRSPRVYDPLHYTTVRPRSASFSSNSEIVSHVFLVLMKSKMKISSLRVPWKKPILLLRVQKAVNTNISKRLIKDLP